MLNSLVYQIPRLMLFEDVPKCVPIFEATAWLIGHRLFGNVPVT